MTDPNEEYHALRFHPDAVKIVRAGQRREGRALRMPLHCSAGHRTGVALELVVSEDNGLDDEDYRSVPPQIVMSWGRDLAVTANPGKAVRADPYWAGDGTGKVWPEVTTIHCRCGWSAQRQHLKLLRAAIERIVKVRQGQQSSYRITLT
ncbi:hypothetical protein [Pseudarthrobacter sulfonivorans]|uniref:hypothetical protein n=1 Tax=Pseudarthrobacter sulfonivorans TaxID=121292 RepID=UPI002861ED89|nr:hypothetical protein [Pseudarthrobacter sulfonivorans]MDR6414061.1 hypothetical protein [Pseudarthrobacter sulfonivorans]